MIILSRYPGSCHRDGAGLGASQSGGFIGSFGNEFTQNPVSVLPLIQAACYQHGGSWNVLPLRLHYGINRQVRHGLMRLQNLGVGSHSIFRRIRMYLL